MSIIDRIKNILMVPKSEFPTVKAEAVDIAALPAIGTLLSFGAYWGFSYRLRLAIISYLVALASFYISAFIINELAQTFQSTKNLINALKLVGYAATASMVGQLLAFLPGIGWLLSLADAVYSIYLFYLGMPVFMDTPQEKTILYMVMAFIVSIVVYSVLAALLFPFFGVSMIWANFLPEQVCPAKPLSSRSTQRKNSHSASTANSAVRLSNCAFFMSGGLQMCRFSLLHSGKI